MSLPSAECRYVTDDCLREWRSGSPGFKLSDTVPVLRFLYELCSAMVRGELPFPKCKVALDSVVFTERVSGQELGSCIADVVTQMAQDLTMPGEYRARLLKLAKWLVESGLVALRLFQERCEEEFLAEAEMIKIKAQELKSKEVRVNTRLLYQQTKFNLLREESEGYAKLVTLLCGNTGSSSSGVSGATIGIIKSLIGHFDLDPNRVFDIVLECFELQPDNNVFLELIPLFPKSHAAQILGFKFQYYQRMEVNTPVPFGLYKLTALLVREEFIDLDTICVHLLPKDEEAFEHYNAIVSKRLDEGKKIGKINLAATGKDLMETDEKPGDVNIDLFAALDMEADAVSERSDELENNQLLGLLSGFLSVDDWYHSNLLLDRLAPLNPVEHLQICNSLFRLIEKSISSVYPKNHHTNLNKAEPFSGSNVDSMETEASSFVALPKELFQMLSCAGPFLYRDSLLLQKVCRVLRAYYSATTQNSESRHLKEARSRIEEAVGTCLLPSLQLIPANPAVGQEIWEVLSLLPYEVRYRLYGEWEKEDERVPMLLAARQTAKLDTRRILKRLAKENLKQLGRSVAKLAHANPMTVLRTIVHQIEAYRDMITPVVDAFKYLTQLEYDILEYVVIERLVQGGRDKLKDDGLNLSDWLQSLASFWGHLCKKYPSMELRGLFQYLVNQLKKGIGIELVLLQELIQQMANVQFTENLTEEQLDAMAGSETLRYQATSFGVTRNNKALVKSTNRLRDSLLPKDEPKLAIPLLLLIAQHRSLVVVNADAPYIKMVSEQFDRSHGMLLQYVEFLCSSVTPLSAYVQMIPSLDDLIHQYHLDPEVAFLIYRPVMRLFKIQGSSDIFWPLNNKTDTETDLNSEEVVLDNGSSQRPTMWSDLLKTVRTMFPPKAWNSLSPDLYTTFWGLTLYDLYVPRNRYDSEISKQHAALKALEELSDNSSSAISKRKKDKERIQESLDRLISELKRHEENVSSVRKRLSREKDKWLSSCPEFLKINMEFLQRCIFPRCTFSMPDAVYCAEFVHTLHSLGTPFFNTVNHVDVLICKTLQPMICCCTEFEAGRLGRFLYETLKLAYYWKSDESVYERECGNMPGFAVYYRYPNSQRVTYGQFIKVHWKWSQRITRLLIQCLESSEYMEIRNSLIILTKISGVFPVTRKSGINLEKRVSKIKGDDREDLKVLATGVAAALASRKPSWVTDEEFGMGYLELKPAPPLSIKSSAGNAKVKVGPLTNGPDVHPSVPSSAGTSRSNENQKQVDEAMHNRLVDENTAKLSQKPVSEPEIRTQTKRTTPSSSLAKTSKQDLSKEDRPGKSAGRTSGERDSSHAVSNAVAANGNTASSLAKTSAPSTRLSDTHNSDSKPSEARVSSLKDDGAEILPSSRSIHSPRNESASITSRTNDKQQKRGSPSEEADRLSKRRKGDSDARDFDGDLDKSGTDEQGAYRASDKLAERSKDKASERHDKDHRERSRGDDTSEKSRERSMERYSRERSVERVQERGSDRNKARHNDTSSEKSHGDERFHGQSLPPPPPLPPHMVPHSLSTGRREEESDRRFATARHTQRLSPRGDEKERRRSEESLVSQEDTKRRREDDIRDRKREDRDNLATKVEERERDREREREKAIHQKEEMDANAASKRRKLKRDHPPLGEPGEYSPVAAPPPLTINMSQPYDARDRKGAANQRGAYLEEPSPRVHGKEMGGKLTRRDVDPMYDREWDDEKRQRTEQKRRHRK